MANIDSKKTKKGRVFQVIGVTKSQQVGYIVFDTRKNAQKYIDKQDKFEQCELVEVDVYTLKGVI